MRTRLTRLYTDCPWLLPVTIGFLLRVYDLTRSSIWRDEGYTMWLLNYGYADLIARTARDVHPPLYYLLAKTWACIFGHSVFSIRFMSVLFSLGTVFLAYRLMEILWDKRAAFWTAMFVAFSPFMIHSAQEARMYAAVGFFTILATYGLVRFAKDGRTRHLVYYTLAMTCSVYTHYFAFFAMISLWLIFALSTKDFRKLRWVQGFRDQTGAFDRRWCIANGAVLALYLPWLPIVYRQLTRLDSNYWIKPETITLRTIPGSVSQFLTLTHMNVLYAWGGPIGHWAYWLIIAILVGAGVALLAVKSRRKTVLSLFIFGFLPMVLAFALSKIGTPIYQDRYFSFSAVALLAIWGAVVATIKAKPARVAVTTFLLLAMIFGMGVSRQVSNQQMEQIAEQIDVLRQAGDQVLSGSLYTFLDGSYYFGYGNIKLISEPVDGFNETSLFYDQQDTYVVDPALAGQNTTRVWVLSRPEDHYTPEAGLQTWSRSTVIDAGTIKAELYIK